MPEEGRDTVSYEMLQDLLRAERRSNKLMPVAARFWLQVRDFLGALTEQFRQEQAKDPFSRRVMLLTDEVKNARHAADALWALRERKLAMLALAATRDRKRPDGITPEEAGLYARLLAALDEHRAAIFEGMAGAAPSPPAALAPAPAQPSAPAAAPPLPPMQLPIEPAPMPAAPASRAAPSAAQPQTVQVPPDTRNAREPLVTIRALGDIPPFVGRDMETYLLKAGDIATVPPAIAELLVKRGKAAVIDV